MVIINPDGMFSGDRMAKLSDEARLYWPWFYLASNGFGRVEFNYRKLVAKVFSGFNVPPSEAKVMQLIQEYRDAYLLFPYVVNGQLWGQWDTSEKFLPRHKRAEDNNSPVPPREAWMKWKNAYSNAKAAQVPVFATLAEIPQKFPKVSADFGEVVRVEVGVDVEVGVGVENQNLCTSDEVQVTNQPLLLEHTPREDNAPTKADRERWFRELFWPNVWSKIAIAAARSAWLKKVKTKEQCDMVVAAAKRQGPAILDRGSRLGSSVLHPATWLNQERYADEMEQPGHKHRTGTGVPIFVPSWEKKENVV